MARDSSHYRRSPGKDQSSPRKGTLSRRERSQERNNSSRRNGSPLQGRRAGCDRSPTREIFHTSSPVRQRNSPKDYDSPVHGKHLPSRNEKSRSPSPRAKRIKKSQGDRAPEKLASSYGRSNDRIEERGTHRGREIEKVIDRDLERMKPEIQMAERRSEKRGSGNERRGTMPAKVSKLEHSRSISPSDDYRRRQKSHSPNPELAGKDPGEIIDGRSTERGNDEDDSVAKMKAAEEALEAKQKEKPSFELSGKLAAETNRLRGVTLLFNEPSDARKPDLRWQLFVFKGGELLNDPLYIHRQTCYLFGRERRVADIPTDHPSCSKQHAVLQFRQVIQDEPDGTTTKKVRPYLMDLGSTNKTFINDSAIEPQRYYELFEKDTIKFGNSSREYVLLHENSAG